MTPTHRERQIMQRLRGAGWIKAFLIPNSPKTLQRLLAKGWIESQGTGTELAYQHDGTGFGCHESADKASLDHFLCGMDDCPVFRMRLNRPRRLGIQQ